MHVLALLLGLLVQTDGGPPELPPGVEDFMRQIDQGCRVVVGPHGVRLMVCPQHGDRVETQPACPHQNDCLIRRYRHRLADRRINGDAGPCVCRGHGGFDLAWIDQMARMRGDDMSTIAAVLINSQAARGRYAHIVFLGQAGLARPAA